MGAAAQRLPYVDEHSIVVGAAPRTTWEALLRTVERSVGGGAAPGLARALGCEDTAASGPRPLAEGATIPGFHVDAAQPPRELSLLGGHRFSAYALTFRLEPAGESETRLSAETRAEFPGRRGGVYRALVIGTRGHVLAVKRILGAVRRRAEKP